MKYSRSFGVFVMLGFVGLLGSGCARSDAATSRHSIRKMIKPKTAWVRDELVRSVKRVKIERAASVYKNGKFVEGPRKLQSIYTYTRKGEILSRNIYSPDGRIRAKTGRIYDANGQVIELYRDIKRADGTASSEKHVMKRDSGGVIVEDVIYQGNNRKPTARNTPKRDPKGRVIESDTFDGSGKLQSKLLQNYDSQGNVTEQASYGPEGEFVSKTITSFDASGNMKECKEIDRNGSVQIWEKTVIYENENGYETSRCDTNGVVISKIAYHYDAKWRLVEEDHYSAQGSLESKTVTKYNPKGNRAEIYDYRKGALLIKTLCSYNYDSNGNWTKRIQSKWTKKGNPKPVLVDVTYRTIEYYK